VEAWSEAEKRRKEREKTVKIICSETGEEFEIKKKVAIPLIAALRAYQGMNGNSENRSNDQIEAARILLLLSEIT
jgi:hypothetical protein